MGLLLGLELVLYEVSRLVSSLSGIVIGRPILKDGMEGRPIVAANWAVGTFMVVSAGSM